MLCQTIYLKKVLEQFYLQDCKPVSISIKSGIGNFFLPSKKQVDKEIIK